jgi:hypothetical protein
MATTLGCTNPNAANYNPVANQDDGSCYYLNKVNGVCYAFEDAAGLIDESFTLSWSVIDSNWVFFHDFIADMYFSTRESSFSLNNGKIYRHNVGAPGIYYGNTVPFSFLVDVCFHADTDKAIEQTLNTLNWITEVVNADGSSSPFETLTHITVWNSYQCSGRITLSQVFQDLAYEVRKTAGRWSFNDFRNQLTTQGVAFLQNIFNNFALAPGAIPPSPLPWYEQQLLEDNYFIVRFEFDNTSGKKLYLLDVNAETSTSFR